jgi:hypothetical protein
MVACEFGGFVDLAYVPFVDFAGEMVSLAAHLAFVDARSALSALALCCNNFHQKNKLVCAGGCVLRGHVLVVVPPECENQNCWALWLGTQCVISQLLRTEREWVRCE